MRLSLVATPWIGLLAIACSVPIASRLDERGAGEVVGALNSSGIAASKERDPEEEARWLVVVGRSDASSASEVLQRLGLPRRHSPGLLEALGDDALISSPVAEQARWSAGTAAELERSLQGLANVLSVRVHLAIPVTPAFPGTAEADSAPTASVLLQYTGAAPPLPSRDIQRLIAGAVPGLAAQSVQVVMRAEMAPTHPPTPALSRFGPLTIPRHAAARLRVAVAVAIATCLTAIGLAVVLWLKLRRIQGAEGGAGLANAPAKPQA